MIENDSIPEDRRPSGRPQKRTRRERPVPVASGGMLVVGEPSEDAPAAPGLDAELTDDVPAAPPVRSSRSAAASSPVLREMNRQEELSLRDYISQLQQGEDQIQIKVIRKEPKKFKTQKTDGLVGTYERPITEEEIAENHGGGHYSVRINRRGQTGSWAYWKHVAIDIPGDPRLDDVYRHPDGAHAADGGAGDKALGLLERELERARKSGGADLAMFQLLLDPLKRQNELLEARLQRKDEEIARIANQKPPAQDGYKDKLLDKMLDGDNARILALRTQHESELRALKESHRDDIKRAYDQAERERASREASHTREIDILRQSHAMQLAALETAHKTKESVLEGENRRLERENERLSKDLDELRKRKEQTTGEKIKELKDLKDLISGDEEEGEEKSKVEQVVGALLNSETAKAVAGALATKVAAMGSDPAAPATPLPSAETPQLPPPGQPFRGPGGQVMVVTPNGAIVPYKRRRPAPAAAGAPAGAAPVAGGEPGGPGGAVVEQVEITQAEVTAAVGLLEAAYRGDQPPAEVAHSVRLMIPERILRAIRSQGIEHFLDRVAQLDSGSPLAQQAGRNYARKVAKELIGD